MDFTTRNIDWDYLLERLEHMLDLGEEYLTRKLEEYQIDPLAFQDCLAFRWIQDGDSGYLAEVHHPDIPYHEDLLGIDRALERLKRNTLQFVRGVPANNVLLWGARGNGKSSAIKGLLREFGPQGLRLVEVQRDDLFQLPNIAAALRDLPFRFVLFCSGLTFDASENEHRELKNLLEGGIESRPDNILVYATGNQSQPAAEPLDKNDEPGEILTQGAMADTPALFDLFGIILPFYPMNEQTYLAVVTHLAAHRDLAMDESDLEAEALRWSRERRMHCGRVARQFVDDLSGRLAVEAGSPGQPASKD